MNLVLISFLLFSQPWGHAEKKYIWLYEKESNSLPNKWENYHQIITPNNGIVIGYTSDLSIHGIAARLYENHLKHLEENDEIILIGHGIGGLVARSLKNLSKSVTGIITIGTAHNGSELLRNAMNGKAINLFAHLTVKVNKAFDESTWAALNSAPHASTLAKPLVQQVNYLKNKLQGGTLSALNEIFRTSTEFNALNQSNVYDLLPNSRYIKKNNETILDVPMVNIYGSEDPRQVVRAMGTQSKLKNVMSVALPDEEFDREFLPGIYSSLAAIRKVLQTHNIVYNALAVPAKFSPTIWFTRELILKAHYNWVEIYRYLDVDMDSDFALIMGAVDYKFQNYCIPSVIDPTIRICKMKYLPYMLENDGLYSKTDVLFKGKRSSPVFNVKAQGVNHLEMRNHPVIANILHQIIKDKKYGKEFSH